MFFIPLHSSLEVLIGFHEITEPYVRVEKTCPVSSGNCSGDVDKSQKRRCQRRGWGVTSFKCTGKCKTRKSRRFGRKTLDGDYKEIVLE